ncbi:MAG: 3-keto-disaccharide hydrolase [Methyloligellaceae bacterium]
MKTAKMTAVSLLTAICLALPVAPSQAGDRINLLEGDLAHFTKLGDANWSLKDGVLSASGGKGFLVTKEAFANYELKLEFYPGTDTNSGVFMRCANPAKINDKSCYEANIFDKRKDQSGRTGGIPNYAPPAVVIDSENQWNTYEITAKGSQITVKLNGKLTVDVKDETLASGPIALQFRAGSIKFRNVQIRKL